MFVTTKSFKLFFVLAMTLIMGSMPFLFMSNVYTHVEAVAAESPIVISNNLPFASVQPAAPMASNIVLVGLNEEGTVLSQSDTDAYLLDIDNLNSPFSTLPIKNIDLLLSSPQATTSRGVTADGQTIYRVHLGEGIDVQTAIQTLNNHPAVAFAEPDYLAHIITIPNDPLYMEQWGLSKIEAPQAWDVITGSTDVVIAVIDSGMDIDHPDLAGQLWTNPGEIAGNGVDDDNNGYVDDIHGWNMVDDNGDLSDNTGHGTEVAGIMAATGNNGLGVTGVCWQCQLMVVKVTQSGGVANYSDIVAGIAYAAQKGADVINLSLGGYSDSITLKTILATASETAVVVGGAGNDNGEVPFYPATYGDSVLAVASTTISDTKAATSNYGSWIDISAPGEVITTTFDGGSYGASSGTSLSAPFAAGLAGLLKSQHPDWSAQMIQAQMIQTAADISGNNPSYDGKLGSGRLNAAQAFTADAEPQVVYVGLSIDGEENGRPEPGSTADVVITLSNEWQNATNVQATLTTTSPDVNIINGTSTYGTIATYDEVSNTTPFQISISAAAPYATDLSFQLALVGDDGYTATIPVTVTTASGIESVSGIISANTTWTSDRQYIMTGNILVPSGITLTIEAGTTVKVDTDKALIIEGALIATGTDSKPILFTSNAPEPTVRSWSGIEVRNSGVARIEHCEISFTYIAVQLSGLDSYIYHCFIHHNETGLMVGNYEKLEIRHNRIFSNTESGIAFPSANTEITFNEIAYNGQDGIQASTVLDIGLITNNLIHHNGSNNGTHFGIFGGWAGTVTSNTIVYNLHGVAFEQPESMIYHHNNNLENKIYDVDNSFAGGGSLNASNNWWGTLDTTVIDQRIYDFLDDFNAGLVNYTPILTAPVSDAPAYLQSITVSPDSPIGIETATFLLAFSRPMNQSIDPVVTFRLTESPTVTYQVIDNAQWLDSSHWQATFDVTSLIPRGTYMVTINNAKGTDGLTIPPDTQFQFTVDYAGEITDKTPPDPPAVFATGINANTTTMTAIWSATDQDSVITGYRYAIGSAPGAIDIISWTEINNNQINQGGLNLVEARRYWLSVQARNNGGLWSASGYGSFVAGQANPQVFLPIVLN